MEDNSAVVSPLTPILTAVYLVIWYRFNLVIVLKCCCQTIWLGMFLFLYFLTCPHSQNRSKANLSVDFFCWRSDKCWEAMIQQTGSRPSFNLSLCSFLFFRIWFHLIILQTRIFEHYWMKKSGIWMIGMIEPFHTHNENIFLFQ